ncbi:hypothetical protein [Nocardia sp. NPDC004750]
MPGLLELYQRRCLVILRLSTERIDVLTDRKSDMLGAWLRDNPGVEVVVRDRSATYAEAIWRARAR